jgi:hypothetical protein
MEVKNEWARDQVVWTLWYMEATNTPIARPRDWWVVPSRALFVAECGFGTSAVVAGICVIALRHSNGSGSAGSVGTGVAMIGMVIGLLAGIVVSISSVVVMGRAGCSPVRQQWSRGIFIGAWVSSVVLVLFSMVGWSGHIGVSAVMVVAVIMTALWAVALSSGGWLLTGREEAARVYRRRGVVVGVLGLVSCWGTFLALVVVALSNLA